MSQIIHRVVKTLFVALIVRPIVLILLGLNVSGRKHLPLDGPAIIAANHNSHLDILVILSIFPLSKVHKLRAVAAADYFLANPLIAWFSIHVLGIIPLSRKTVLTKERLRDTIFSSCHKALDNSDILVIFPEGTRGLPEKRGKLKKGIYYLCQNRADTPVIPLLMYGLGRALPRGEALFVPFNCDVVISEKLPRCTSSGSLVEHLDKTYSQSLKQCLTYHEDA